MRAIVFLIALQLVVCSKADPVLSLVTDPQTHELAIAWTNLDHVSYMVEVSDDLDYWFGTFYVEEPGSPVWFNHDKDHRFARLKIDTRPPSIINTLKNLFLTENGSETVSVQVRGNGPLTYQWFRQVIPIIGETNYARGETNRTLMVNETNSTLTVTAKGPPTQYWVEVHSPYGGASRSFWVDWPRPFAPDSIVGISPVFYATETTGPYPAYSDETDHLFRFKPDRVPRMVGQPPEISRTL